jgi:hypothetical protein
VILSDLMIMGFILTPGIINNVVNIYIIAIKNMEELWQNQNQQLTL